MKTKFLITSAVIVLSILAVVFLKANLGIDFSDANLFAVDSDNIALTDNILVDANNLPHISRIERIDNDTLYLYFQNLSDNVYMEVEAYAAKYGLSLTDDMIYRYSRETYYLIVNRSVTFGMIVLFVLFIYQGFELRGLNWKRWQVGYYIVTDFLLSLGSAIVLGGISAVLGELGLKMNNEFVTTFGLAMGVVLLFRIYEVELVKRVKANGKGKIDYKDLKAVFKSSRKPELVLVACVLLLAGFLPFVVLSGGLTVMSFLLLIAIGLSFVVAIYIKPDLLAFMLEQGDQTALLKKKALEKEW